MHASQQKPLQLPYLQPGSYWIGLILHEAQLTPALTTALNALGFKQQSTGRRAFMLKTAYPWADTWQKTWKLLTQHQLQDRTEAILINSESEPAGDDITLNCKAATAIDTIACNLWLAEALIEDRLICHMQPVMDKRGKIFGYESFARINNGDGTLIGGGKIIKASQSLNIERIVDRHLHIQAVRTFINSDLEGFLFVNFVPGFIHRPEVYLEGLTEAALSQGLAAKHIVLEFTKAELPRDPAHLKAICDYCRSKGYAISLDDLESTDIATRLVQSIKPDFMKLDIELVQKLHTGNHSGTLSQLVALGHKEGSTVIAEGVENTETHQILMTAGVDLFQGYLFSPPVAAPTPTANRKNTH